MLNYLSAEWYKLRRTKGLFLAVGLLLVLIALLFWPFYEGAEVTPVAYALFYLLFLPLGLFLAPIFAARAFDDQYGRGTLKNEIVFGIPRSRIYLGKLIIGAGAGTVAAALVLALYLTMCFLGGGTAEEYAVSAALCLRGTLFVLPLWLASLSLSFFLEIVTRSSAGGLVASYLILIFGTPISLISGEEPTAYPLLNWLSRCFFTAPLRELYQVYDEAAKTIWLSMGRSWLVGMGWIAVTTLMGMAALSRREIN